MASLIGPDRFECCDRRGCGLPAIGEENGRLACLYHAGTRILGLLFPPAIGPSHPSCRSFLDVGLYHALAESAPAEEEKIAAGVVHTCNACGKIHPVITGEGENARVRWGRWCSKGSRFTGEP